MSYLNRLRRSPATASAIVASSAVAVLAVILVSLVCLIEPGWPPTVLPRLSVIAGPSGVWGIWWEVRALPPASAQTAALLALTRTAAWLGAGSIAIALLSLALHAVSRILAEWRALAVRCALGATLRHLLKLVGVELLALGGIGSLLGLIAGAIGLGVLKSTWPALLTRPPQIVPALGAAALVALLVGALLGGIALMLLALLQRGVRTVSDLHGDHVTAPGPLLFVQSTLAALQLAGLLVVTYGCLVVVGASGAPATGVALEHAESTSVASLTWTGEQAGVAPARAGAYRRLTHDRHDTHARAMINSPDAWLSLGRDLPVLAFCGECKIGDTLKAVNATRTRVIAAGPGALSLLPVRILHRKGQDGRGITAADTLGAELVTVISRALGAELFPNGNPIMKTIRPNGFLPGPEYRVVGVAETEAPRGLGNNGGRQKVMYVSLLQHPATLAELSAATDSWPWMLNGGGPSPQPSSGDPHALADQLELFARPLRWFGWLFTALAGTATAVAGYALLAVMVQMVKLRRRDIAIRLAVGAAPHHIMRWVTGKAVGITVAGVLLGLSGARWLGDFLQRYVSPAVESDLWLLLELVLVFGLLGVAASLWPARRAARVDPAVAWADPSD